MSDKRGLGDLNWLPDRTAAEESMYRASDAPADEPSTEQEQGEDTGEDQPKRTARKSASRKGGQRKVTPTALDEAPPPPGRQREARVQFNHRILMDRHEVLEGYKAEHGATWQGIVDQMVDEYLARRGLLPNDSAEE